MTDRKTHLICAAAMAMIPAQLAIWTTTPDADPPWVARAAGNTGDHRQPAKASVCALALTEIQPD